MHLNKIRCESDVKCRALHSSSDGEIEQFRSGSYVKIKGNLLFFGGGVGDWVQTNSDLNQTSGGELYNPHASNFQRLPSKQILGRGFQTQGIEYILHSKSESSLN